MVASRVIYPKTRLKLRRLHLEGLYEYLRRVEELQATNLFVAVHLNTVSAIYKKKVFPKLVDHRPEYRITLTEVEGLSLYLCFMCYDHRQAVPEYTLELDYIRESLYQLDTRQPEIFHPPSTPQKQLQDGTEDDQKNEP